MPLGTVFIYNVYTIHILTYTYAYWRKFPFSLYGDNFVGVAQQELPPQPVRRLHPGSAGQLGGRTADTVPRV